MKSQILVFLVPLYLLMLSCGNGHMTPEKLAEDLSTAYQSKTALSYDIDYRIKYFKDLDDTTRTLASADLVKIEGDTVFGGAVWIGDEYYDRYYNGKNSYYIYHYEKEITRYPVEKPIIFTGSHYGEMIRIYFLKPERLINSINNPTNNVELKDEGTLWNLTFAFPDYEDITDISKNVWINKDDFTIPKMNYLSHSLGESQYNQWDISNLVFDKVTLEDLEERFSTYSEQYEMVDYAPFSAEDLSLLSDGSNIPNIEGIAYKDSNIVTLDDNLGYLTLYDFWYMDCPPCIEAIPQINETYLKYKDKGFRVVGLDPFDNNENSRKRLPNFLDHVTIDYPIVFVDYKDVEFFNVYYYPTIYLADRNGRVVYSEYGKIDNLGAVLDSLIQVHL